MLPARSTLSRKPILIDLPMSMHEIRSSLKASPAIKENTINETWTNFLKRSTISDTTQAKSDAPKIFPLASSYTAHRTPANTARQTIPSRGPDGMRFQPQKLQKGKPPGKKNELPPISWT